MVDVYHEFSEPQKMLRALGTALKPVGGSLLLEYRKEDPDVPIRFRTKCRSLKREMELELKVYPRKRRWPPAAAAHSDFREIAHVRAETEQSGRRPPSKALKAAISQAHKCHSNRRQDRALASNGFSSA